MLKTPVSDTFCRTLFATPEEQLLCHCAKPHPDDLPEIFGEIIAADAINWQRFIQLADQQEIYPLIHRQFSRITAEQIPAAVRRYVQDQFHANARRTLQLTAAFNEVIARLQSQHIPVIAYKGPVLALMAYENLLQRQFSDLDILVFKKDLPAIDAMLSHHGFVCEEAGQTFTERRFYLANNCEFHYLKSPENIYLEVHWRFFENHFRFPMGMADVWERRRKIELSNQSPDTLTPEDHLLVLCAHGGGKHHWSTLKMIADMAALVTQQPQMDWDYLRQQSSKLGIQRLFHAGMRLSAELLDATIPGPVLSAIRDDTSANAIVQHVIANLFRLPEEKMANVTKGTDKSRFYLQTRERLRDRLPHFWHVLQDVFTPTDQEEQLLPLPKPLTFLHRIFRPVRLSAKYIKAAFKSGN